MKFEEYFRSNAYGYSYYKRVLFEGFVIWYQYSQSAREWDMIKGMGDKEFPYLTQIKKSEVFIELL